MATLGVLAFSYTLELFLMKRKTGGTTPQLVWAKNVDDGFNSDGSLASIEGKEKRVKKANEWVKMGIPVTVFWIDDKEITSKMNMLFGADTCDRLKDAKFDKRGDVRILTQEPQSWVRGMETTIKGSIEEIEQR